MDKDPLLARDWIKMSIKFAGFCIICKQKINPAEMGYWSREAKSILHQDCYSLSGLHTKKIKNPQNSRTDPSQKNGDILMTEFITQRENKEKCFICGNRVNFHDNLILTLLKLERNINALDTIFCSTCLTCFDLPRYEEYKRAFLNKLKLT
jgi:hypothetical protein